MSVAIQNDRHDFDGRSPIDVTFARWRVVHRGASFGLGLVALVHAGFTVRVFDEWSPNAVWFLGAGLGLLLLAAINIAHVGLEPCRLPTTPAVRLANWVFVVFGTGAVLAVPEPQAALIALLLAVQAGASHRTPPGPA